MKRFRLRTVMLFVMIVALLLALVAQQLRAIQREREHRISTIPLSQRA